MNDSNKKVNTIYNISDLCTLSNHCTQYEYKYVTITIRQQAMGIWNERNNKRNSPAMGLPVGKV